MKPLRRVREGNRNPSRNVFDYFFRYKKVMNIFLVRHSNLITLFCVHKKNIGGTKL